MFCLFQASLRQTIDLLHVTDGLVVRLDDHLLFLKECQYAIHMILRRPTIPANVIPDNISEENRKNPPKGLKSPRFAACSYAISMLWPGDSIHTYLHPDGIGLSNRAYFHTRRSVILRDYFRAVWSKAIKLVEREIGMAVNIALTKVFPQKAGKDYDDRVRFMEDVSSDDDQNIFWETYLSQHASNCRVSQQKNFGADIGFGLNFYQNYFIREKSLKLFEHHLARTAGKHTPPPPRTPTPGPSAETESRQTRSSRPASSVAKVSPSAPAPSSTSKVKKKDSGHNKPSTSSAESGMYIYQSAGNNDELYILTHFNFYSHSSCCWHSRY